MARKKLSENLDVIITRHAELELLAKLKKCKAACDTTTISKKNTELRRQYITEGFQTRLQEELKYLQLRKLPIKISDRSDYAASYLGVSLETKNRVLNSEILSDGEFRALALACFLTEVKSIPNHNGIILDDPVSSLDHLRTRRVAERLVAEAEGGRQVIIFTHDLVFYYELLIAAAEAEVPVLSHWIRFTREHGFGTVLNEEDPWHAKKIKQRIAYLENKLGAFRKTDDKTGDKYRDMVVDFYTDLRETWERLVEELLFNGAVTRFQPSIMTQSLRGARIDDEDYRKVYFAMKKASEYSGHDRTRARQISLPEIEELEKDLDQLNTYSKKLKQRNETLEKTRRKLESPPKASVI